MKGLIKEMFNSVFLFFTGGALCAFYLYDHVSASWLGWTLFVGFLVLLVGAVLDLFHPNFSTAQPFAAFATIAFLVGVSSWFYIVFAQSYEGLSERDSILLMVTATINLLIAVINFFEKVVTKEEVYHPAVRSVRA